MRRRSNAHLFHANVNPQLVLNWRSVRLGPSPTSSSNAITSSTAAGMCPAKSTSSSYPRTSLKYSWSLFYTKVSTFSVPYQLCHISPKFFDAPQDLHPPSLHEAPAWLVLYDSTCTSVFVLSSQMNGVSPRRTLASKGTYLFLLTVFHHPHCKCNVNVLSYCFIYSRYLFNHHYCLSSTTKLVLSHLFDWDPRYSWV